MISALLPAKITEIFRISKLRRKRLGKKWSGYSLKRAVRISQNAPTFHPAGRGGDGALGRQGDGETEGMRDKEMKGL